MPPMRIPTSTDIALLLIRLSAGLTMLFAHGMGKLGKVFAGELDQFADPIGIGQAASLVLAAFAEGICALLIALGLFARAAAIPPLITMLVAALIVHADDPWGKKELAFAYATAFLAIAIAGPGRYSLDHAIGTRLRKDG